MSQLSPDDHVARARRQPELGGAAYW